MNYCSSNLLSGSPPSSLSCVNNYTVCRGGGYGVLALRQINTIGFGDVPRLAAVDKPAAAASLIPGGIHFRSETHLRQLHVVADTLSRPPTISGSVSAAAVSGYSSAAAVSGSVSATATSGSASSAAASGSVSGSTEQGLKTPWQI